MIKKEVEKVTLFIEEDEKRLVDYKKQIRRERLIVDWDQKQIIYDMIDMKILLIDPSNTSFYSILK